MDPGFHKSLLISACVLSLPQYRLCVCVFFFFFTLFVLIAVVWVGSIATGEKLLIYKLAALFLIRITNSKQTFTEWL